MTVCRLTPLLVALVLGPSIASAEPGPLKFLRPAPHEVVQRQGFEPHRAHAHEPGGPKLGFAQVPIELELNSNAEASRLSEKSVGWQYRLLLLNMATGTAVDWTPLEIKANQTRVLASARVPAGGWYRLEVRARRDDTTLAEGAIEPVGVGEVFVVAGQSYAVGANDELTKVDDPEGRVVAYDVIARSWRVANDPQPNCGDGGTIWPAAGNLLLPLAQVPIAFVNVAVGGTASRQWLPGEKLYQQLADAGATIGRFRAVLWQQGESDVIEHRTTDYYVDNLKKIRAALAERWGFEPPWLLAKSTLHPTVYRDPEGEGRIRAAIDQLWALPGFRPGPDTDILAGENRGDLNSRRHFSGIGQRRAGQMWFAAIWQELNR